MHADAAYLFRHVLVRDAAYQLQVPGDRARLHAMAVDILDAETRAQPELISIRADECSQHCAAAAAGFEDTELAKRFRLRELDSALIAAEYFDKSHRLGDAARVYVVIANHPNRSPSQSSRALARLCKICVLIGPADEALRYADRLELEAQDIDAQVEVFLTRSSMSALRNESAGALLALQTALDLPGLILGSPAWIKIQCRRAMYLVRQHRLQEALSIMEETRQAAQESGDAQLRAQWLNMHARVLAVSGKLAESEAGYREALGIFEQLGDKVSAVVSRGDLASVVSDLHRNGDSEQLFLCAIDEARQVGDSHNELVFSHNYAVSLANQQRDDEALSLYRKIEATARERGFPKIAVHATMGLAQRHINKGLFSVAADILLRNLGLPMDQQEGERGDYLHHLVLALDQSGRRSEIVSLADDVRDAKYPPGARYEFHRYFACAITATALQESGQEKRAQELAQVAWEEAKRLNIAQRFKGNQRNRALGEICRILGIDEPA